MIFFWGLRALRLQNYKGEALGGGRSCISVTSRLIKIKFSGNATFYIYFISQISIFLKYIHIFQKYVLTYVGSAQKNGTTSVNHLIWRVFFAGCIYLTLFKDLKVFFFLFFFRNDSMRRSIILQCDIATFKAPFIYYVITHL